MNSFEGYQKLAFLGRIFGKKLTGIPIDLPRKDKRGIHDTLESLWFYQQSVKPFQTPASHPSGGPLFPLGQKIKSPADPHGHLKRGKMRNISGNPFLLLGSSEGHEEHLSPGGLDTFPQKFIMFSRQISAVMAHYLHPRGQELFCQPLIHLWRSPQEEDLSLGKVGKELFHDISARDPLREYAFLEGQMRRQMRLKPARKTALSLQI